MLELKIKGSIFGGFTEARVNKTMKALCGEFEFLAGGDLTYSKLLELGLIITKDSIVEILADGIKIMTAYIEKQNIEYSDNNYSISLSGREVTCDIVDCRISTSFRKTATTDFIQLTNSVFNFEKLKYSIIDKSINSATKNFLSLDIQAPSSGEAVIDFLNKYAMKKYCALMTDENGNFLIANSGKGLSELSSYKLRNVIGIENNIWKGSVNYDFSQLYNTYTYQSIPNYQDIIDSDQTPKQQSNIQYTSNPDESIRVGRNFVEVESESYTLIKLKDRVSWKMQTQIANSRQYNVVLDGHSFIDDNNNKVVIKPNQLIDIVDETCNINETMLVNEIIYSMNSSGNSISIELVQEDAYNLISENIVLSNKFYGSQI
tara:strand:- start:79 stop:1203 length:1125 start_codon:yes stop_codon:yes gene_type:complete